MKTKIIIGVIALLLIIISVQTCRQKSASDKAKELKQELLVEKANTGVLRSHIVYSVQTLAYEREISAIDSAKAVEAQKTKVAEYAANYHAKEANRLRLVNDKNKIKLDSLLGTNTPCPDMLNASLISIDGLRAEKYQLDSANIKLDKEAEGYSSQLLKCEKQRSLSDSIIESKQKYISALESNINTLQCYREWGLKNKFWRWILGQNKCK